MRLRFYFWKDVPARIKRRFLPYLRATKQVTPIKHDLTVSILASKWLRTPGGKIGVGAFDKRHIHLCAGHIPCKPGWRDFIDTYCHELAHYEQWRDHRRCYERGVAVRARTLIRQFEDLL